MEELDCTVEQFFLKTKQREDIRECQVACEDAVFRILSFPYGNDMIVLWGGILPKFQDMQGEQIERAVCYKNDFLLHRRPA